MKKILAMMLVAFVCATANAQLVTSTTVSKQKKTDLSGMFLEVGLGKLGADVQGDGLAIDFGLGYRHGFNQYVAWDILKAKAFAQVNAFGESITPQVMTGIRGTSPVLFAGMTAFASFSLGYGYAVDFEAGGFAYEIQAGLNVLPKFNIGFVYDNQKVDWFNMAFTGLRLGVRF